MFLNVMMDELVSVTVQLPVLTIQFAEELILACLFQSGLWKIKASISKGPL